MVGYILADSRADALVVSAPLVAPLLPVLHSIADLRRIIVVQPDGGTPAPIDDARAVGLAEFLAGGDPATPTAATPADEVAFWLYSSGSTGAPKGVRHVHGSLRATADTYGAQVLQIRADDLMFSAAKAFHAYGLGNCMTFPMSVGARAVLLPDRPTPDAVLDTMQRHQPTIFAGVPTLLRVAAGQSVHRSGRRIGAAASLHLGRRGAARATSAGAGRDMVGVDILDGIGSTEMLHIFCRNRPDDIRYGTQRQAGAGLRRDDRRRARRPRAERRGGRTGGARAQSAADGYWNQRDKTRRTFRGEWTHTGDTYIRDADGYYRFCGRTRRDAEGRAASGSRRSRSRRR